LGVAISLSAQAFTGTQLYSFCDSDKNSLGDIACNAYVRGFTDGLLTGQAVPYRPERQMELIQARLLILKFMRDHPEMLDQDASFVAGMAVNGIFPCGSK
jgi:hypothetical protein